mgnify:FL=1
MLIVKKNALTNKVRDDFSEVYLFFDYDLQHSKDIKKTNDIVIDMLNTFNNETEAGKLYISYPMVEALKDLKVRNVCSEHCCVCVKSLTKYKSAVGAVNCFSKAARYDNDTWRHFCLHAVKKSNCIVKDEYMEPSFERFINELTGEAIFSGQLAKFVSNYKVAVLSAIPLFLLEYFGEKRWEELLSCSCSFKSEKSAVCERGCK